MRIQWKRIARPKRLYQYLSTFSALLAMVAGGMFCAWPSPSLPQLLNNSSSASFHITSSEGSSIAIMQLMGDMTASVFSVVMADTIGRKKSIWISGLPLLGAWFMTAYANSSLLLYIARFIAGLGDGISFVVGPLYIGEIADPEIRGFLGASMSASWILGMVLINIIGAYWSIKTTALVSSAVPVLLMLTFAWMPETPYFLILKQNFDSARDNLIKFRGHQDVDDELERLKEAVREQTENTGKFLDLFVKITNRRAMFVMTILRFTQQFGGISAITFYTQTIFKEAGVGFISPVDASVIVLSFQLIAAIISSLIVDRTGRKNLLIVSIVGSIITLLIAGTYFYLKSSITDMDLAQFSFVPLLSLIGFVMIFNVGGQPIPLLMLGELFSTNVKVFASCLSEFTVGITASLVSKFFQITNDEYGMFFPFYVFACCCFVNLIFIIFFVPETKGKTLEEIQEIFSKVK